MNINFALNGLSTTVDGNPINIEHAEISCELSTQEIATGGGLISALSREFKPLLKEAIKPQRVAPQAAPTPAINNYTRNNNYNKNNYKNHKEVSPEKLKVETKNITKEWRQLSVPEELKPEGDDKYRWCSSKEYYGDSVSVDGSTYGVVYIHMYAMKRKAFIIIRNNEVRYEDDITREEFNEFLENIKIPENIKKYILKVVAL